VAPHTYIQVISRNNYCARYACHVSGIFFVGADRGDTFFTIPASYASKGAKTHDDWGRCWESTLRSS
jgi:hypothetical protein